MEWWSAAVARRPYVREVMLPAGEQRRLALGQCGKTPCGGSAAPGVTSSPRPALVPSELGYSGC